MAYDLAEHPLLSAKAAALKEEVFAEQVALAAERLGVSETVFTGAALSRIKRYLALQLNWQLQVPIEAFYKVQEASSASKQNTTYRSGISLVYPLALAGVQSVLGSGGWADCTSVRRAVR